MSSLTLRAGGSRTLARLLQPSIVVLEDDDLIARERSAMIARARRCCSTSKELMRRSVQFHLERSESRQIEAEDVEQALAEMLFRGGSLNQKLLGADGASGRAKDGCLTQV